jgi:hypothetical protein
MSNDNSSDPQIQFLLIKLKSYFEQCQVNNDLRGLEASNPNHEGATSSVCYIEDEVAAFLWSEVE